MSDADKPQPFTPAGTEEKERNWLPMGIGAALVIVAILVIIALTRGGPSSNTNEQSAYAANLKIDDLHMATAENFAGGSVTYIQGTLRNTGVKKVTGARMQVFFKNSLGETAQKETLPVFAVLPNAPYRDYGPLDRAPLAPGQSRDFRLTLEHVTADWDGQMPTLKIVSVSN
jgi:hypothetical protein